MVQLELEARELMLMLLLFGFTSLTAEHLVGAERPDELELPCACVAQRID